MKAIDNMVVMNGFLTSMERTFEHIYVTIRVKLHSGGYVGDKSDTKI